MYNPTASVKARAAAHSTNAEREGHLQKDLLYWMQVLVTQELPMRHCRNKVQTQVVSS